MNFENKGKWFNESEDTDKDMLNDEQQELAMEDDAGDLLADDELNLADEDIDDDSEGIFNDEEQVDEACRQKDESWSDLYPVVAEIGTDWEFYKKKPKYTRNELKQAAITKLKAKGKSFNSQDLEEALNRWYASESAQKNEAKLDKGYDISFDNIGGGFTVEKVAITNGYGIELSGYSSNTSKKLTYVHPTLSNDSGLTQDVIREHYDALNAKRTAIAKDLKPLADKFDKDIEAVFAKHGFKKA